MNWHQRPGAAAARRRPSLPASRLTALDATRIERALAGRARYRYVQPRVQALGTGWVIVSPNCSRKVDPAGGDIAIAWFEPLPGTQAQWRLHRRDHARNSWLPVAEALTLSQALERVCRDPLGVWWP